MKSSSILWTMRMLLFILLFKLWSLWLLWSDYSLRTQRKPSIWPTLFYRIDESTKKHYSFSIIQFSSVAQSCPTLCNSMDCSTPGLPVHYQLQEACPLMKSLGTSSYLTALASQRMWANTQVDHTTQPSSLQETGVKRPSGVSDK